MAEEIEESFNVGVGELKERLITIVERLIGLLTSFQIIMCIPNDFSGAALEFQIHFSQVFTMIL